MHTEVTGYLAFLVIALELPTSGFSDAFGRKPVLVAAALANLVTLATAPWPRMRRRWRAH